MPEHVVTVTYTEELIRSAAWRYWKEKIGINGLICVGLIAASCLVLAFLRSDSWIVGFFAGTAVICAAIVVVTYFTLRNNALRVFRKMDNKTATVTFMETAIRIEADTGSGEIAWK
jgi:hypothetical protein